MNAPDFTDEGRAIASGTVALMLRTEPLFGVSALRVSINYRKGVGA